MRCNITGSARRAAYTTLAAIGFTALVAHQRPAQGQDLFQEGGSRLYLSRPLEPDTTDAPATDLKAGDSQRSPIPTVEMEGDTLVINSVAGTHTVYIIGVEGKPGAMTVHFDDFAMQLFFDVQHIDVNLPHGNQFLALLQVNVAGNVMISAGDGDNQFFLGYHTYDPNLIGGDLSLVAGQGSNGILLEESWILGDAELGVGDGGNYLVLGLASSPSDLGAVILGGLTIVTGAGDDLIEVVKSWIGGQTLIDTADGEDTVILGTHYATGSAIAGNVFNGDVDVATGHDNDGVGLTDNEVYGAVSITLQHDDDELLIGAGAAFPPNDFHAQFSAHGGSGQDLLDEGPGNAYTGAPQFQSFELP